MWTILCFFSQIILMSIIILIVKFVLKHSLPYPSEISVDHIFFQENKFLKC